MLHYLDHAATCVTRPAEVAAAMSRYITECGATPGRGGHQLALEAGRMVLRTRRAVLEVLGLEGDPGRVVFTANATHALNTALLGVLGPGDAVVVTDYDHNAVRRPMHHLAEVRGVEIRHVSGAPDGSLDLAAFEGAVDGARLVALNAVSNVLGTRLPVEKLARTAREAGALVLVDAAQSAGHVPVSYEDADLVAFTGHKGLLGPQGTGGLWVRPGVAVDPLLRGGTGGDSREPGMPDALPDRLEAGTLNGPGLAGLLAGIGALRARGLSAVHAEEMALKARLRDGLASLPGVEVLSPPDPTGAGIVALRSNSADPATLARRLDRDYGVLTRAGLHCAPDAHRLLGTAETGALRASVGWGTSRADVDRAIQALDEITRPTRVPTG